MEIKKYLSSLTEFLTPDPVSCDLGEVRGRKNGDLFQWAKAHARLWALPVSGQETRSPTGNIFLDSYNAGFLRSIFSQGLISPSPANEAKNATVVEEEAEELQNYGGGGCDNICKTSCKKACEDDTAGQSKCLERCAEDKEMCKCGTNKPVS